MWYFRGNGRQRGGRGVGESVFHLPPHPPLHPHHRVDPMRLREGESETRIRWEVNSKSAGERVERGEEECRSELGNRSPFGSV